MASTLQLSWERSTSTAQLITHLESVVYLEWKYRIYKKKMCDLRFQWFKYIIYKTLSIDFSDSAFDDMIEKNQFATEHLTNFIHKTKACIFFYCTVEEEEVEVEGYRKFSLIIVISIFLG